MELQISYRVCTEISAASDLWKDQGRGREDIKDAMRTQRGRNHRSGSVPESYPYAGEHTAEVQRVRIHGIPEGKKLADDL